MASEQSYYFRQRSRSAGHHRYSVASDKVPKPKVISSSHSRIYSNLTGTSKWVLYELTFLVRSSSANWSSLMAR